MQPFRALIRMPLAALMLAMLALAMRALVPAGYMPSAEPGRLFAVVLCEGTGGSRTVSLHIPADGKPGKSGDHATAMPCAFAALALAALDGPPAPAIAMLLRAAPAILPAFLPSFVALAPLTTGPPATGPPAFR